MNYNKIKVKRKTGYIAFESVASTDTGMNS